MTSQKLLLVLFITIFSNTAYAMQKMEKVDVSNTQLFLISRQVISLYATQDGKNYTALLEDGSKIEASQLSEEVFFCRQVRHSPEEDVSRVETLDKDVFFNLQRLVEDIKAKRRKTSATE